MLKDWSTDEVIFLDDIDIDVSCRITVGEKTASIDDFKLELLYNVSKAGSIKGAAREMGISYSSAKSHLKGMESSIGADIIKTSKGGFNRGGTSLNDLGFLIIKECMKIKAIGELYKINEK